MLSTIAFGPDGIEHEDGVDLARRRLGQEGIVVWVDSTGPDHDDLETARELFGLHELAIEDVCKHGQRAKLERYEDHAFVVTYARAGDGDLSEVDFFLGGDWVFSVRERNDHGEMVDISDVKERLEQRRDLSISPGAILYALFDAVVDGYFVAIEAAEDRLEDVEEELFSPESPPDAVMQQDLLAIRRRLILFRRRVVPMRDVVMAILRGEVPQIGRDVLVYYEDVLDHLLRLIEQIDLQRELVGNVVDASLALSSNRMNQVMKRMTSWGAILIVATLIAGIYGMNFKNIPELEWHYGYFGALATMALTTGGLYFWFKRKGWL
ncbi:MAG TPA: magnesium/cobalt transporter CorA [Acidimicrobiales bacterium]